MLPEIMVGFSSKSFMDLADAQAWTERMVAVLGADPKRGEGVFVCTSHPLLPILRQQLEPLGVMLGVQDVSRFPKGAYTGEVSAAVLAQVGAQLVMIGHPERFKHLGETLDDVRAKCAIASEHGIVPILIAGEPSRDSKPEEVLKAQFDAAFADMAPDAPLLVAYEPTWAIGAPEPAPPEHIVDVVSRIRAMLADRSGDVRVVYGGSAGAGTFAAIAAAAREQGRQDGIPNGVFLGRAGLDPDVFLASIAEVRANH